MKNKIKISMVIFLLTAGIILPFAQSRLTASVKTKTHSGNLGDCTFKGISLHGKVQFVDAFPDIKIQVVTAFPDLKVKMVDAFPDDCGEWQAVTAFPDFKVQVVDAFPDIKIQYVDAFPGLP